ncbi:cation transporter [candidate division KSB1 bacterium]|nr:cation transporter [candidate division KSB1 bacterium]
MNQYHSHEHDHLQEHDHHGHHHPRKTGLRLFFTIALNFFITIIEVAGGLISGSLSLLSDALHNFSDTISLIISYIALVLSRRANTPERTFGYKRAEVIAALFNSSVLIIISFFLFKEAIERFLEPTTIHTNTMIIVAVFGLIANLVAVLLLHGESKGNLNIRSAYLHLLADTFSSVGVIIGGIFIHYFKILWIDPLLTILIGLYILRESYFILKESLNILIQATPLEIDINEVVAKIREFPEVKNAHHVHIWQLNDKNIHLEGHIEIDANWRLCEADELRLKIEKMLKEQFNIEHITLQMESDVCFDKSLIMRH